MAFALARPQEVFSQLLDKICDGQLDPTVPMIYSLLRHLHIKVYLDGHSPPKPEEQKYAAICHLTSQFHQAQHLLAIPFAPAQLETDRVAHLGEALIRANNSGINTAQYQQIHERLHAHAHYNTELARMTASSCDIDTGRQTAGWWEKLREFLDDALNQGFAFPDGEALYKQYLRRKVTVHGHGRRTGSEIARKWTADERYREILV